MKSIAYSIALTAFAVAAFSSLALALGTFIVRLSDRTAQQQPQPSNSATDYLDHLLSHSYAVLVSTNLVPQNCPCGVCDPSRGIAVPEHIYSIGHDLRLEVSTNYLPLITK